VCGSPATHPPLGSVEMSREISPIPGFQPQWYTRIRILEWNCKI
jgi:hypothetical protein